MVEVIKAILLFFSSKIHISSNVKTQINLSLFFFWADWAVKAALKISDIVFYVFMGKTTTIKLDFLKSVGFAVLY